MSNYIPFIHKNGKVDKKKDKIEQVYLYIEEDIIEEKKEEKEEEKITIIAIF
jgi:hypothetical protein